MISTAHRFKGYTSLRYVYKHGQTVRGPLFAIKALQNPRRSSYRLAVVVSRKVNKSAVKRNRIRRRLYETVRLMQADIIGPWDLVITVFHDSIVDEPAASLERLVRSQLQQVGALGRRVTKDESSVNS